MKSTRYIVASVVAAMAFSLLLSADVLAQQRIGYIDSDYILDQMPEYATVEQNLDRLANDLEAELRNREEEIEEMFREYQARELLYSQEERQQQREEIIRAEQELDRLHEQYFGPDGEFYEQQDEMMRPIQERILATVEELATDEGYDYVFDRSGDFLFLYATEDHNLTNSVLERLGIDIDAVGDRR